MKLEELVQAEPQDSSIDLYCECCRTLMRKHVSFKVKGVHVMEEAMSSRNETIGEVPMLFLRICSVCWVQYLGFCNNVANGLK